MGESFEAAKAVIGADAAFSHTAEGEVRVGQMQDALIDTATTKLKTLDQFVLDSAITAEDIGSERVLRQSGDGRQFGFE